MLPISLVLIFITVLVDVRSNKIPNIIQFLLVLLQVFSIIFSYSTMDGAFDFKRLRMQCLTIFFIFIILFVFFSIGGIGAGDLKLLLILAFGLTRPLIFVALTFLFASVISVFHMIRNRNILERLTTMQDYIRRIILEGKPVPYYSKMPHIEERLKHSIHLSIPISIAYLVVIFIELRMV